MSLLRIGSLFAGIGGLDLGVEHATGGLVLWQVERDPWCRKVLARHWPDAQRYDDVCTVATEACPLAEVDLVCGGFPCQPVSLAGAREGIDDERWLWPEFERVLRVVRPRFALLENVRGILTASDGRALAEVLGGLARLGFSAEWDLFRASDVGAPHRRERWFCLAYRGGGDGVGVGLADPHGVRQRQPQGGLSDERGRSGDGGEGCVADPGCVHGDRRAHGCPRCGADRAPSRRDEGVRDAQCGGGEPMVDAASARREGLTGRRRESSRRLSEVAGGGSGVALGNPDRQGSSLGTCERGDAGPELAPSLGARRDGYAVGGGVAQSGVGRGVDGLPGGLDAHRWPAGRGEAQYAWEPPRTSAATPNRRARLKALGNAVVPQQAALALRVLSARAGVGAELTAPRDGATSAEEVCDG